VEFRREPNILTLGEDLLQMYLIDLK
jgi:hypothetical protein